MEMATLYSMLGSHVHIVEMANEILPMMDGELVGMLRADFARKGLRIHTRAKVIRIENRGAQAAVYIEADNGEQILIGENVLFCVGRKANTEALGLDACGIDTDRSLSICIWRRAGAACMRSGIVPVRYSWLMSLPCRER